ncbi:MAG: class I SAM-dependent methyltransferase [Actinomycetota bacterium]|nr:class I SAM-dependent methyltransferase [Actinomycetota bacterium]
MVGDTNPSYGAPDDEAYYRETREMLEESYLGADDPRGQSGFRGDEARWERARRPIVSAVDRDGTFLDVGCANGLLMESLAAWAAEDGYKIEPYGLDLIDSLAALARRRLPQWADRIFTGNVTDWQPPFRFDFVRTELEYAPAHRRQALVERLLREFVVPGGRVIVCSYGSSRRPAPKAEPVGEILRGWGYEVAGQAEGSDVNGVVFARVAWIDRADP